MISNKPFSGHKKYYFQKVAILDSVFAKGLTHDFSQKLEIPFSSFFFKMGYEMILG